jgi:hypothetical protein
MKVKSLSLMSKNNRKTGKYLYLPVVEIDNSYYYCECILSSSPITKKDVVMSMIKVKREIQPQFYLANGIEVNKTFSNQSLITHQ